MTNYGFIIGIVLTVGGCFISNLGTNLQVLRPCVQPLVLGSEDGM
jgi:hypothetical protein